MAEPNLCRERLRPHGSWGCRHTRQGAEAGLTDASVTRFAKPRAHQPSADPPRSATDTGLYRRRLHRRRPHRENSRLRQTDALPRHPPALCWKRGSGAGRLGLESFSFVPDRDTRQRRPHRRRPQEAAALGNYATAGARRPHRPCVPRCWLGPAEPPPRRPRAGPAGRSRPVSPGSDSPRAPLPTPNRRRKRRAPTGDTPSPPPQRDGGGSDRRPRRAPASPRSHSHSRYLSGSGRRPRSCPRRPPPPRSHHFLIRARPRVPRRAPGPTSRYCGPAPQRARPAPSHPPPWWASRGARVLARRPRMRKWRALPEGPGRDGGAAAGPAAGDTGPGGQGLALVPRPRSAAARRAGPAPRPAAGRPAPPAAAGERPAALRRPSPPAPLPLGLWPPEGAAPRRCRTAPGSCSGGKLGRLALLF